MAEESGSQHSAIESRHKTHSTEHAGVTHDRAQSPLEAPIYPSSLLADPRLQRSANQPVRVALMRQAQQTYGNRAVRRMIQATRSTSPPAPVAQRQPQDNKANAPGNLEATGEGSSANLTHSPSHGCNCGLCHGGEANPASIQRAASPSSVVIQRVKLGKAGASQIEEQLQDLMDEYDSESDEHQIAFKLFENIDAEVQDHKAKAWLEKAAKKSGKTDFQDIADSITVGSIRTNFYPSGFNKVARQNRDSIVKKTKVGANWTCPGIGGGPHTASLTDVTIDHIIPVATHWNTIGYKTDKDTRYKWYNDTTNHTILCRSCNSSKSGPLYAKQPDYSAGFSHS